MTTAAITISPEAFRAYKAKFDAKLAADREARRRERYGAKKPPRPGRSDAELRAIAEEIAVRTGREDEFMWGYGARERVLATIRMRKHRERVRAKAPPRATPPAEEKVVAAVVSEAQFREDGRRLEDWLKINGPWQRSFKNRKDSILHSRQVLLSFRETYGRNPSLAQFAEWLTEEFQEPWTRYQARSLLKSLQRLEDSGGPWAPPAPDSDPEWGIF